MALPSQTGKLPILLGLGRSFSLHRKINLSNIIE
jgi:hypothetical protein